LYGEYFFPLQQLDSLRRQRDHLKDELSMVMEARNKKQNLSTLEATMHGLQNKIRYAKRDKEVQVRVCGICGWGLV